jgi:adenine deaminase
MGVKMLASDRSVEAALKDVRVALGSEPADLVLRGGRLVNVWSDEVHQADVAMRGDRIVAIRGRYDGDAYETVQCDGQLILPGFVELLGSLPADRPFGELEALLIAQGITSAVLSSDAPSIEPTALRVWRESHNLDRRGDVNGFVRPLMKRRVCRVIEEAAQAISVGDAVVLDAGGDLRDWVELLAAIGDGGIETARVMVRHCTAGDGAAARPSDVGLASAAGYRAGLTYPLAAQLAAFNAATHFGLDHRIGSVTPGRYADLIVRNEAEEGYPAIVIVAGKVVARGGSLV